jgi:hypothetical protein
LQDAVGGMLHYLQFIKRGVIAMKSDELVHVTASSFIKRQSDWERESSTQRRILAHHAIKWRNKAEHQNNNSQGDEKKAPTATGLESLTTPVFSSAN